MSKTCHENAQRKYPQNGPKMNAPRKKEARMTKDNMAEDGNGRATRYLALVGRGSGRSQRQDPVEERWCSLMTKSKYISRLQN